MEIYINREYASRMNDPRNELHALYTLLRQRELNSDIAPRKWLVRENRLGFSGSRMYPSHTVHAVYSKVDAAKEFSHRDESGAAETVCCPIFTVQLLLHATSATFSGISRYHFRIPLRNIAIRTADAHKSNERSMCSIRACCTF